MKAAIIDTETTGLTEPGLLEASYIVIGDTPAEVHSIEDAFTGRFNPGKPIECGAMATHHICEADIVHAPPAATFRLPESVEYIIGHNVDFDWQVIGKPNVKRICTLAFCRQLWPDVDTHTLGAMLYFFAGSEARERLRHAHSAEADAAICHSILLRILSRLQDIATWEAVWSACERARIPERMPFGKHKGQRIADIPPDYKMWLLRQPDVDPYLAKALRAT